MLRQAFAFVLVVAGLAGAAVIGPKIYEQDDLGDIIFAEFVYALSADCNASTINLTVMDEEYKAVEGAQTYLKYVDFSTPLLANPKTDKDGYALFRLPGNVKLMRGLFILVIEKRGFRSKEVHFDLSPCFSNGTPQPPAPVKNQTQTANATAPKPGSQNATSQLPASGNATNQSMNASSNASSNQSDGGEQDAGNNQSACAPALALPFLLLFKSFK